jgi:hypothetical protein
VNYIRINNFQNQLLYDTKQYNKKPITFQDGLWLVHNLDKTLTNISFILTTNQPTSNIYIRIYTTNAMGISNMKQININQQNMTLSINTSATKNDFLFIDLSDTSNSNITYTIQFTGATFS